MRLIAVVLLIVALPPTATAFDQDWSTGALPIASGAQMLTKIDVNAWLDGYMSHAMSSAEIPGAVVVVVAGGQLLTARGFGYADITKHRPVDPQRTLFRTGSISKLITWTAVMQQVEQSKLDLDADINRYLDFKVPARNGAPITLRQIMSLTTGLEQMKKNVIFYDAGRLRPLGKFLKDSMPTRIYDAGTTPTYSNWACALAGYIVERVSGEDFDTYVERHIFAPLGMTDATFRQPLPFRLISQMAAGYPEPGEAAPFEFIGPAPAGSMSATGADIVRLMLAHLQGGALGGQRILSPQTAAMMQDSPLDRVDPASLIPPLNRMELGFFQHTVNGHQVIGHPGDTAAFHSWMFLFIDDGVGFFVSFNGTGRQGAADDMRADLFQAFADRYFPSRGKDVMIDGETARKHVHMISGLWRASGEPRTNFLASAALFRQIEVSAGPNGSLVTRSIDGTWRRDWLEIAPFLWRASDDRDRLAAKLVDGRVVRWGTDDNPSLVFDRVPAGSSAAWLKPAIYASIAILALTFLSWLGSAVLRRICEKEHVIAGRAPRVYRATCLMAALELVVLVAWMQVIGRIYSNLSHFASTFDATLITLEGVGAAIVVGTAGLSGWNCWLTWTNHRRWTDKLASALLFLAALVILYFAFRFNLLALSVRY